MMLKEFKLADYIFGAGLDDFNDDTQAEISKQLKREMQEIFYGRNLPEMN